MNGGVVSGNRVATALIETMVPKNERVQPFQALQQGRNSGFPVALRTVLE